MENDTKKLTRGIQLCWIAVKDIKAAIKFYTDVVGLSLHEFHENHGWAELSGPEGSRLGICQADPAHGAIAGTNAVITITVDDLEIVRQSYIAQGINLIGDVIEVPGQVKMQTFTDSSGNHLQLVQILKTV